MSASSKRPHVVILGGGFAGLEAARGLARAKVDITLIDKQNHHLFQPLLYQVATAALAAPDIADPIRKVLKGQKNVRVLMDEALDVKSERNEIVLRHGGALAYDYLVVAAGSRHTYFGHDEWEKYAPGLKTLNDALEIRSRVLLAFEAAERETDAEVRRELLTFAIIGGGPTGVELAGAISEIARGTLEQNFRNIDPKDARVVLIEAGPRVLAAYPEDLSAKGQRQLEELGVEVRVNAPVVDIDDEGVTIEGEWPGVLRTKTVLWSAGVVGVPLGAKLGGALHKTGRVLVEPDLRLKSRPNLFVIGDLAWLENDGEPVPALAPAAIQEGRHAAKNLRAILAGKPTTPFRYLDKGSLATIGRSRAVGQAFGLRFSGGLAWVMWLFVHLLYLVGFRNRAAVLLDWAWAWVSYQRSARVVVQAPVQTAPPPLSLVPALDDDGNARAHVREAAAGR